MVLIFFSGISQLGKIFDGENGTKLLKEIGKKTPKMMKDIFAWPWVNRTRMIGIPAKVEEFGSKMIVRNMIDLVEQNNAIKLNDEELKELKKVVNLSNITTVTAK
ncbi:13960_t:CDS:2 [Funneliformis caledonium]|uniref:13960_t:CDS:1 n=1 Tax=Funneliformis caledonium TaxID=1117310 RepID=A0A9N8ZHN9_9GLOM|nr:13960_t:CDS:2 [Funneliformis caledonium]